MVSCHGCVSFVPIHWANFAVCFEMLKCIDHADTFLDGATERHVVHQLVLNDTFFIDEE